ncbi:betaine--homocysteine S-methyltransferase 1 [Lingula anatina]|uniref:Betaine--homocysteine S-methyltransferase 1 n=1 Tax=Lingula anatina TaxID=7574 RepID=A0A1S3JA02_LINAN|nr:betaine--homocysteine S-methyltransferase 1 [Lingula anatina]|eukprot:XP_013406704.1 betaine--homocysteine S-methyltransferase 1 [Lingula anatina]
MPIATVSRSLSTFVQRGNYGRICRISKFGFCTVPKRKGILERLAEGPVIGDGSYVITLEKRGYLKMGPFTPEAAIEHPDAVRQLHREFQRAGADVLQAFTFYSTDGKLNIVEGKKDYAAVDLNQSACDIVWEVARTSPDTLVCGGVSPTPTYTQGKGKDAVKEQFQTQCDIFIKNKVDFLLGEFFGHVEEAEWAIEVMKSCGMPVACTLRIGPRGDLVGVPPGECAIRMAKKGCDIVGINCSFDYHTELKTIKMMKDALAAEGLSPYLMTQPLGYHVPEVDNNVIGYYDLPEYPYAMEPRLMTRWDCRDYARKAYEIGVRYIGGCCGFEPYHIRELAEELAPERGGKRPPGADKNGVWGDSMAESTISNHTPTRNNKEYWQSVVPASGRPGGRLVNEIVSYEGQLK